MQITGEVNAQGTATKISKFFQKLFKKVLTKKKRCAILPELPPRGGGRERSLKIEQQESTKRI